MAGQWGGARPGSGRKKPGAKPAPADRPQIKAETKVKPKAPSEATPSAVPAQAKAPGMSVQVMRAVIDASNMAREERFRRPEMNPYKLPEFPKAAIPVRKELQMAMDDSLTWAQTQWAGDVLNGTAGEGLLFLGYPFLSELAQRPEYRVISETIADDATRKWIDFEVTGDKTQQDDQRRKAENDPAGEAERMADPDERQKRVKSAGKLDKVKALRDDQSRLEVQDRFYNMARNDGFFGRSHLFYDFAGGMGFEANSGELKTSIGTGRDLISRRKIAKGSFNAIRCIEPVWCYPTNYNAMNPLRADWYNPQYWFVMGQEVHVSRIPAFVGHPVPDLLKPAYSFGGLSLSQMAKPYVDIWLQTRESVGALIHSFSVMVLMTDMQTILQPNDVSGLLTRVAMFNALRDNQGTFVLNKNSEDFKNVSASLSGLHELQAQAQEHVASVVRIPLVKFTGMQPSGLNASAEGEINVYDDTISAYQNRFMRPELTRVVNFEQLSLWGQIDPEITIVFNPLRQMTEKERGEKQERDAKRDQVYIDSGVLSPGEVRKIIIEDPELPYAGLDPDDVPEPPEPEMGAGGDDEDGGEGGAGGGEPGKKKPGEGGEAANDGAIPFAEGALDAFFAEDDFNEADHPRAPDGKFGSGGSTGGASLDPKKLTKVGEQKGSNPGGVFKDSTGKEFYVKKGQSKAHVRNELLAGSLYALAGAPPLNYRPVDGGNHVATEMAKLDKDRAHKMSPAEVKEAQKDFVTHAWLSNWDAVGTGGDNLGTVAGKPTALDLGGALAYRAQGAPKGAAFGDKVGEIDTLRDPKISPDASKVFGSMTTEQLRESAGNVTAIRDGAIRATVKAAGEPDAMADRLIARKNDIAKRFGLAQDEFTESKHPRDPDGKFASGAGSGSGGEFNEEQKAELVAMKADYQAAKKAGNASEADKIANEYFDLTGGAYGIIDPLPPTSAGGSSISSSESSSAKPGEHVPPGSKKKGAFGGLYKTSSTSHVENHKATVADYLAKPAKSGSHYRNMLAHLIKEAPAIGTTDKIPALKEKLAQAFSNAANQMYAQANSAGTEAEKKVLKAKAENALKKAKEWGGGATPAPAQTITVTNKPAVSVSVPVSTASKATPEELKKAAKATTLPISSTNPTAVAAVKAFNDKWAGKTVTDPAELNQKVAEHKGTMKVVEQANLADQAKTQKAAAEAAKKEADAYAKNFDTPEAKEHYETLAGITSGSAKGYLKTAADRLESAGMTGKMTPAEAAMIIAYSGSHFREVNSQLRAGVITEQQFKYTKALNQALDKLPSYTKTTYRKANLTAAQAKQYKPGFIVPERAFTSTAKNDSVWSGSYHYVIEGKNGKDIQKLSSHPGESEVLFKSNSHFMVTKVDGNKIHMKEID